MLLINLAILILLPFLTAGLCFISRRKRVQNLWIYATSFALIVSSIAFACGDRDFSLTTTSLSLPIPSFMILLDYAVLGIITIVGFKHKHPPIIIFSGLQFILLVALETYLLPSTAYTPFILSDSLATVMVLIVSIIGGLICLFAIPYMKKHFMHTSLPPRSRNFFFAVMLLFLGSMNGLVLSNNILYLYTFFELTTLCSFWLIGFDRTFAATKNALQALWMNSLGGLALLIAVALFFMYLGTLDIRRIIELSMGASIMMLPLCMLILSCLIKSAQPPFQSWLLGAMVAPTPVSALLHSSTMVKVGVYLALRFSPAYMDSFLATCTAIFGAYVFLSAALSAIGQSNGKKILAYSTISNLGLIFACAGIGTPEAITAGVILIIFHAISKALLFLCTGTIEQQIGSRNIEDMHGIYKIMPLTSTLMVIGIASIILPPFGMLMGKWIAIEAVSAVNLPVLIILGIGSSATLLYWTRWAGLLLSGDTSHKAKTEHLPRLTSYPLVILCLLAVILSVLSPFVYTNMVVPITKAFDVVPFDITTVGLLGYQGAFWVVPLFIVLLVAVLAAVHYYGKAKGASYIEPFMCGVNTKEEGAFIGPMNKTDKAYVFNYYFMDFCKEETSLKIFNTIALVIMIFMLGGAINLSYGQGGMW